MRAVIFDQDGLMFDTERISVEAWDLAGAEFGVHLEEAFLCTVRGMNHHDMKKRFFEVFGDSVDFETFRARKQQIFFRLVRERTVPVKPGLLELLEYLRQQGYKIALASASRKEYTLANIKEAGVEPYFRFIITGDMVKQAKPDPEMFLTAAAALGEPPEQCIVLEDSLNGVEAGLRGGFCTIMVPDLTQPDETLRKRVYAVCESLHQVKELLEETGRYIDKWKDEE